MSFSNIYFKKNKMMDIVDQKLIMILRVKLIRTKVRILDFIF